MNKLKKEIQSSKNVLTLIFIIHMAFEGVTSNNCLSKERCGQCIAESDLCAWCTQENFGSPRCDLLTNLKKTCKGSAIIAPTGSLKLIQLMVTLSIGSTDRISEYLNPMSPIPPQTTIRQKRDSGSFGRLGEFFRKNVVPFFVAN
ncbi:hypothetical protein AVEN_51533-1 [Araneus ventricosus]|uniref:PSI domain-containing protein n=1 Tax=Araneus ventricosus TaxID=182803 RepID=A0A4Y2GWF5_ARAVE|nr:hypothetical protein AVEN_51533-1 [Araneus ventricosus]